MVTGQKELDRSNYSENSFEQRLYEYVGQDESQGIQYDMLSLSTSFRFAEEKLIQHSNEEWKIYTSSDGDERGNYKHFYAEFFATINPLLETLRAAYFVSIHPIFENAWKKVRHLSKECLNEPFHNDFNSGYLKKLRNDYALSKTGKEIIEKVVIAYPKLFVYNNLRNNLFHGKGTRTNEILSFDE